MGQLCKNHAIITEYIFHKLIILYKFINTNLCSRIDVPPRINLSPSSSSHYYKPRINTLEHRKFQKGKSVLIYAFIPDFRLPLFQWVYIRSVYEQTTPYPDTVHRCPTTLGVCTRSFLSSVLHCAAVCGPALAQCRPACSLVRSGFRCTVVRGMPS